MMREQEQDELEMGEREQDAFIPSQNSAVQKSDDSLTSTSESNTKFKYKLSFVLMLTTTSVE